MADLIKYYLTDEGAIPNYVILNKGSSNGQYKNVVVFASKVDVINYMQTYMTGQTYTVESNGEWTEISVDIVNQAESFWFRVKEIQS